MTFARNARLDDIAARLDGLIAAPDVTLMAAAPGLSDELMAHGEVVLETWLTAHAAVPTTRRVEGFRLLALQRQGARGDPSFNACRETCREFVYHHNLIRLEPSHPDTPRRLRLGAMVARHLVLFIAGKLETAGLGEFCCSSRPLHQSATASEPAKFA